MFKFGFRAHVTRKRCMSPDLYPSSSGMDGAGDSRVVVKQVTRGDMAELLEDLHGPGTRSDATPRGDSA
jgi:hypothetical protein